MKNNQQGFTLIELMIVCAIIAILSATAVPSYKSYVTKARYVEVLITADRIKGVVSMCEAQGTRIRDCADDHFVNSIIHGTRSTSIEDISIGDGEITITTSDLLNNETLVLTPYYAWTEVNGRQYKRLEWDVSGSCVELGYCPSAQ